MKKLIKFISIIFTLMFISSCSTTQWVELKYGEYETRGILDNNYVPGLTKQHIECMYVVMDDFVESKKYVDFSNDNFLSEIVEETYLGVTEGANYVYYSGILVSQKPEDYFYDLQFVVIENRIVVFTNPRSILPQGGPFNFLPRRDGLLLYTNYDDFFNDENKYGTTWDNCKDRQIELVIRDS